MNPFPVVTRRNFLIRAGLTGLAACSGLPLKAYASSDVRISTPSGNLLGLETDGVRVFRGVPFAEPPTGSQRFLAPKALKPWQGERDATRFAAAAMQPAEASLSCSEDCLYLNVWAPKGPGPFPVFVWIHGGGFQTGRSSDPLCDGAVFAREGIVCVSVAYRLGVFGFLDMESLLGERYRGSANNALRDLMAALQWIQNNIEAFGGDPTRVTIGGESAGAKLTDVLMGIPSARPLFHQMISESGGAERVWSTSHSKVVSQGFADVWHQRGNTDLLTAPAVDLIGAQKDFVQHWPEHFPLRVEIDGTLIPQLPVATIAAGSARGKRLLIGTMRDESALFIGPHPQSPVSARDLGNLPEPRFAEVASHYRALYPDLTEEQLRIRSLTAEEYWIPSMRVAQAHERGGGESWMYRLDFSETSGAMRGYAYHSMDVRLVWNKPSLAVTNASEEAELATKIHHAWSEFIRGRVPASTGLPVWPSFNSKSRPTMVFDNKCRVEDRPQEAEFRLWEGAL